MATFLGVSDLLVFAPDMDRGQASEMIRDATALAELLAPCIAGASFTATDAVRAILREAIIRRHESGSGALRQKQIGPFGESYDTRSDRKSYFWPSEIAHLQGLCATGAVYSVSLAGP